jgi:hypothetical protein
LKCSVMRNIMLCSPLKVNWHFRETCHLCLQLLHAGFFFYPEDEGDIFLWNVSWFSTDYKVLYPRRQNTS